MVQEIVLRKDEFMIQPLEKWWLKGLLTRAFIRKVYNLIELLLAKTVKMALVLQPLTNS